MALSGVIDGFYPDAVHGWAYDTDRPDRSATVALEVNGRITATIPCDMLRQDLADKQMGTGRYGFSFDPRAFLGPGVNRCRLLFGGTETALPKGARVLIAPVSANAPDATPVLDPASAWNEAALIPRFYRNAAAAGLPRPTRVHVVGLFNSGTNYLARLLAANQVFGLNPKDHEMQSKHLPLDPLSRLRMQMSEEARTRMLYAVSVRDPFRWVDAMRNNRYEAEFAAINAPLSMPKMSLPPAGVHREPAGYDPEAWDQLFRARNIVDYWNRYHAEWIERGVDGMGHAALLRYEDLVTQPCEMVRIVRAVLDMPQTETIAVNVGSAKPEHGTPGDFWVAKRKVMVRELGPRFKREELAFITRNLSEDVCRHLGYEHRFQQRTDLLGGGR